jgi:hypothetical protein
MMLGEYLRVRPDDRLVRASGIPVAKRAFQWLQNQDANNFGLIDSPAASDWLDSSLNRSGKVLYNNVLYYAASLAIDDLDDLDGTDELRSQEIVKKINMLFWPEDPAVFPELLSHVPYPSNADVTFAHPASLSAYREACKTDRTFYLSHVEYGSFVDLCDVLANSLAVLYGIATRERSKRICSYIHASSATKPFPARTYEHPVSSKQDRWQLLSKEADRHQDPKWRNSSYRYHNAGVWPFVGGFYVAAMARAGLWAEASSALSQLAAANQLSLSADGLGFNEWIDSATGEPGGAPAQAWSAAAFIYAYESCLDRLSSGPGASKKPFAPLGGSTSV